ncbi:uncharacterized protein MYCFIDRAFT_176579 [Pseudocercospora fijiensis CIRAD86]|uniref:Uncharacterized protein n=1 Tax=Pseudocercospora fijiensis (strain CIRAD86) TaxID=383855 RepID=M3AVZ6_PSEFD|nr:uncharacterized protein MYCFIDRAFT_176579 [Pseudocercospora fijiensis CIRAD86]EME81283.1 hypothetical protein MYCFIDRAFT_176579 [Pseudocercospora fijiensis CIRAD86]
MPGTLNFLTCKTTYHTPPSNDALEYRLSTQRRIKKRLSSPSYRGDENIPLITATMATRRTQTLVVFLFFLGAINFPQQVSAQQQQQDPKIVYPTTAAPSATPLASAYGYVYAGCWNETVSVANSGGIRALSNGNPRFIYTLLYFSFLSLTYLRAKVSKQHHDNQHLFKFLEYLSALSEKLNKTARCDFACDGNSSQICGGRLALTLYNRTNSGDEKEGGAWRLVGGQRQSLVYGVVSGGFVVLAALLLMAMCWLRLACFTTPDNELHLDPYPYPRPRPHSSAATDQHPFVVQRPNWLFVLRCGSN